MQVHQQGTGEPISRRARRTVPEQLGPVPRASSSQPWKLGARGDALGDSDVSLFSPRTLHGNEFSRLGAATPEICTPTWRVVDHLPAPPPASAEFDFTGATSSSAIDGEDENTDDEAYQARHAQPERIEKKTRVPLRTRQRWVRDQLIVADYPFEYVVISADEEEQGLGKPANDGSISEPFPSHHQRQPASMEASSDSIAGSSSSGQDLERKDVDIAAVAAPPLPPEVLGMAGADRFPDLPTNATTPSTSFSPHPHLTAPSSFHFPPSVSAPSSPLSAPAGSVANSVPLHSPSSCIDPSAQQPYRQSQEPGATWSGLSVSCMTSILHTIRPATVAQLVQAIRNEAPSAASHPPLAAPTPPVAPLPPASTSPAQQPSISPPAALISAVPEQPLVSASGRLARPQRTPSGKTALKSKSRLVSSSASSLPVPEPLSGP